MEPSRCLARAMLSASCESVSLYVSMTAASLMSEAAGARGMLKEKRREVGNKAGKLKGGLQKLRETGEQVADMQVSHLR